MFVLVYGKKYNVKVRLFKTMAQARMAMQLIKAQNPNLDLLQGLSF